MKKVWFLFFKTLLAGFIAPGLEWFTMVVVTFLFSVLHERSDRKARRAVRGATLQAYTGSGALNECERRHPPRIRVNVMTIAIVVSIGDDCR